MHEGPLAIGDRVGPCRVTGVLGRGGMGIVYAAYHTELEKNVALKVLTEYRAGSDAVRRFIQEAKLVNRIGHPNIVDIFSYGELPSGCPYFVMELLHGRQLSVLLHERAPMPFSEGLPILRGMAEGLAAAHAQGIVHRDLKPENIFVLDEAAAAPRIKLVDFGIAKLISGGPRPTDTIKTRTGTALGSPLYMSPEQCAGQRDVDQRADIYTFGVIAYRMFTGRLPFIAASYIDVFFAHVRTRPPPPSRIAQVPPELERVILRALEKEPRSRYQTIGDLLGELEAMPPSVAKWKPAPLPAEPADASSTLAMDSTTPKVARALPRRGHRAAWAALALAATAVVVAFLVHNTPRPVPPPPAAPKVVAQLPPAPATPPPAVVTPPGPPPKPAAKAHRVAKHKPARDDGFLTDF